MKKEDYNVFLKSIITSTIEGEEHLGKNLKESCIDYISRIDKAIEYYEKENIDGFLTTTEINNLLEILKGEPNNE